MAIQEVKDLEERVARVERRADAPDLSERLAQIEKRLSALEKPVPARVEAPPVPARVTPRAVATLAGSPWPPATSPGQPPNQDSSTEETP